MRRSFIRPKPQSPFLAVQQMSFGQKPEPNEKSDAYSNRFEEMLGKQSASNLSQKEQDFKKR
jgi:hypothetical protein